MSATISDKPNRVQVNDIHSELNPTWVEEVVVPQSLEDLSRAVLGAAEMDQAVSIAGSRHSMGGQQFGSETILIDTTELNRLVSLDKTNGLVEVEAGITWPSLLHRLHETQSEDPAMWSIVQKQTGADELTIGGALSANVHGRGLVFPPIIQDVESFKLLDARADLKICSRTENPDLFRLVIGGYGLFGVIASATLRLMRRVKLQRRVQVIDLDELPAAFEQRIAEGYLYGDFQYLTDENSDSFLRRGVFSCYLPVEDSKPVAADQLQLSPEDWKRLYYLAFTDKSRAYSEYAAYYLRTDGQYYWSDTHQLSTYLPDYHQEFSRIMGAKDKSSLMITEVYVPSHELINFMESVRKDIRSNQSNVIYGTIRLVRKDSESFLVWADQDYMCVIFNLVVTHTESGLAKARRQFQELIDRALEYGGNYYLTYHRWARRDQVLNAYPQFLQFISLKQSFDSGERFQSDWYRHHKDMLLNA